MATIAEMFIEIGADTAGFERDVSRLQSQFDRLSRDMQDGTRGINREFANLSPAAQNAFASLREATDKQRENMKQFRDRQLEVKAGFLEMAQGAAEFNGTNDEFIAKLKELGTEQKKISEEMMANNEIAKTSFLQTVGTLLSASSQASKIEKQYDNMSNPLYQVNDAFLQMADRLNGVAQQGAPAVLALRMLGPTANMHQLNQQVMLITAGLMRFQMVSMFALAGVGIMFAGLNSMASDAVPGYKDAMDKMGAAVKQAFMPMVEIFAAVMIKVAEFITWVANLINKFNEAHPVLAKIIQGFLMLIPILFLILSPMSIGIGLFNGMLAAFNSIWMMIQPMITGLAAMSGTVLLVAGVVAVLIGVLIYLWNTNETFRNYIIGAWESIKQAAITAWNYIYNNVLVPVINAVRAFIMQVWGQIQTWWDANQKSIMTIVQFVWNFIQNYIKVYLYIILAVITVVWNLVKGIIVAVWDNIKGIIQGAVTVVLNIISFFTNLLTGNWSGAWESIKNIVKGAWDILANIVGGAVNIVLGLIKGLGDSIGGKFKEMTTSFYNAGKGFIEQMIKGIQSMIGKVLDTIGDVAGKIRDFLPFSPAKVGPLSDLDKLDFGGPVEDSISNALPRVQSAMQRMLQMPAIKPNLALAGANSMLRQEFESMRENEQRIEVPVVVDGREIARATATHMGRELNKIAATKQRASGNK